MCTLLTCISTYILPVCLLQPESWRRWLVLGFDLTSMTTTSTDHINQFICLEYYETFLILIFFSYIFSVLLHIIAFHLKIVQRVFTILFVFSVKLKILISFFPLCRRYLVIIIMEKIMRSLSLKILKVISFFNVYDAKNLNL